MEIDIGPDRSIRRPATTLALLAVSHAVVHATSALLPLVYPFVIVEFGLRAGDIGLFIAVTTAIGGTMQLSYGVLTRYVARPVLLGGGHILFGLGLMAGGLTRNLGQLMGAIGIARIGSSPQHPVGNAILSDRFPPERRGIAISAHISGGNVGTILVPFAGLAMIHAWGWQTALALFGAPALVVGTAILLLVREDHDAYRQRARTAGSVRLQVREVLSRPDLRAILLAALAAAGGRGLDILAPFMLLYFAGPLGFDETTRTYLYMLLLVGAVVGPLLAGWLSDRYGRRRILVLYYALMAAGILAFLGAGSNLLLLVPLMLPFGTAVFSESPVLQAFLADRAAGRLRDMAFAVYFTAAFGIGAFWALVIGTVVDAYGFGAAFGLMAASYVVAGLLVASVREPPAAADG